MMEERAKARTNEDQGIDNPAMIESTNDGSVKRPDLVISVQPRGQNSRAELPVLTVNWRSNSAPGGSFIPLNGLDFLIGVSRLLIQQTVELDSMTSTIDSENRYIVRVPDGEALYIASEVSSPTQRCLCGSGRSFVMHLHDNTRQEALMLERRLAAASCCFPCRLQEMKVVTPPGDYVGRIQQRWTWVVPFYLVRDANDDVMFVLEGPAVIKRSALMLSEFKIMTGDSLREVGKITHGWDRDLVSFVTTVTFPTEAVQPKHKALLLAAAFLMSIEWYSGRMVRNTMHGVGEYRWRYSGPDSEFVTYEGHFFANHIHGYGVMSYPDGRVFVGLYGKNVRWGPGVECTANLHANVGFWRGTQLVRLAWRPETVCLVPDLTKGRQGPAFLCPFRTIMERKLTTIEVKDANFAIELLQHEGADPKVAIENWTKLYSDNCTDLRSPMCQVDIWNQDYYGTEIESLIEQKPQNQKSLQEIEGELDTTGESVISYFAWNNTPSMVEMMKHCYKHDKKRSTVNLRLAEIVSGERNTWKAPAQHERDCRTLLMASYLGHITNVARLINEADVYPDIADVQGNTALMYATCGNNEQIIHFLVEAGANVNSQNDSCCTPLGVALMWYLCAEREIGPHRMLECLLPPETEDSTRLKTNASEWLINRDLKTVPVSPVQNESGDSPKKQEASNTAFIRSVSMQVTKEEDKRKTTTDDEFWSSETFNEQIRMYYTINQEYKIRIRNLFAGTNTGTKDLDQIEYFFEVREMVGDVCHYIKEQNEPVIVTVKNLLKKPAEALKANKQSKENIIKASRSKSKTSQNTLKVSQENMKTQEENETTDKMKEELLGKIMSTILQLLSAGADPRMVVCPKPALFLAVASGNTPLIRHLVRYGADINEVYAESYSYRPIDVAVSLKFSTENLAVVRALLECGADTHHRLTMPEPTSTGEQPDQQVDTTRDVLGPTLLHAVLARKTESVWEEDIQTEMVQALLEFHCDPTIIFMELSVIDMAMIKSIDLVDLFIKTPAPVNLNAVINGDNQTILVKIFSPEYFPKTAGIHRFPILTKLLLYGADPLLECQNGDATFGNMFEYAKKVLYEEFGYTPPYDDSSGATSVVDNPDGDKMKASKNKSEKTKVAKKASTKVNPAAEEYFEAVQSMTQCGRMALTRWIQAKLMAELVGIIGKFKQRYWHLILKEHDNKKRAALWLNPHRCLEMWDIFKDTRQMAYQDDLVLKHLLCIVLFYNNRWTEDNSFNRRITMMEKTTIDSAVKSLIKEYRLTKSQDVEVWMKKYAKPELCSIHVRSRRVLEELVQSENYPPHLRKYQDKKFNVCFDCALPLKDDADTTNDVMVCCQCELVRFCSKQCFKRNIYREGCHPCSDYFKRKYLEEKEKEMAGEGGIVANE